MYCGQCGQRIDDDSRFCRHCGAAQPIADDVSGDLAADTPVQSVAASTAEHPKKQRPGNGSRANWIVGGIALVFLIIITNLSRPSTTTGADTNLVTEMMSNDTAATDNALLDATISPETEPAEPATNANWTYRTDEDKIRGAKSYFASTTSTNTVHQDPPYDPDTSMTMTVRKHPSYGTDVVLRISSGQMMCPSYDGCSGMVRFDDGRAERVNFNGPEDNSSDTIFVIGAKSFIAKLKKSKKVVIEKTLYEAGNPVFEFDVAGLKWDH